MRPFLATLATGVWFCAQVWTLTSYGTYFITGPEYQNVYPHGSLNPNVHQISKFPVWTGDAASPMAVLECGRRCLTTPGCSSILLHPRTRTCFLTSLDRCVQEENTFVKKTGHFFYEMALGTSADHHITCFRKCLSKHNGSCTACGRPNCQGSSCDTCPKQCWEMASKHVGNTYLWSENLNLYPATCDNEWQLVWPANVRTPTEEELELRAKIVYQDGTTVEYYYQDLKLNNRMLSVGSPSNSTSLDWWKAPFQNREIFQNDSSNCLPFFYPPGECQANGVPNSEEQILTNGSVYKRGFAWKTGSARLDAMEVLEIELWAAPKQ